MLQHPHPAAQPPQLLQLTGGQPVIAQARIQLTLADPVPQRLLRHPQVLSDLAEQLAASSDQPDRLNAELRRIGRTSAWHMDSSPGTGRPQRRGVHHSGSTPYIERPCLTIGLAVQPEVLQGLAGRPGFRGRGLLARFLYSLPESLVGRRQAGAPAVPPAVADRYAWSFKP